MKTSLATLAVILSLMLATASRAEVFSARQSWDELCAKCHGANGEGKTKIGIKMRIKDYTAAKVQAEFTDVGLLKDLLLGVSGDKEAERMPAYKDKMTVAEAKELVALIRSFKK